MSLTYPNRADWLKIRATPRNVGTRRYVHVSTDYRWVQMLPAPGSPVRFIKVRPGTTYRKPK